MPACRFFSVIIPAHNEEGYLRETLERIQALDYPRDRFETLVVENGSSDATLKEAERFANSTITVISIPTKGVSSARNAGIERMSSKTDWVVFLDADTLLAPSFLRDLDAYLARPGMERYSVGTTSLLPARDSRVARLWFAFYDLGHYLTKTSYSLFLVRAEVLKEVRFDERMSSGEDLRMIRDARRFGAFFFFRTKTVATSTRRFDKEGWLKVLFSWTFVALLPQSLQRRIEYKVVR